MNSEKAICDRFDLIKGVVSALSMMIVSAKAGNLTTHC